MNLNDASGEIKNQIDSARAEIDRQRKLIAKLEKKENEMYERAADAMNILEENGYDPEVVIQDISKEIAYTTYFSPSDNSIYV